jgi:TP901 family phage tail tape measure protein
MASTGIIYRLVAHDSASRTFDRVGRSASATDRVLGKLGRTAKLAGEAVAVGLAAGLAKGAKDAARFQSEMTRISTQAGGTAKDVKVLSDQVLKLGTSTQQGPQHLAESLYHLKSVGMDNVSAMKALKQASDLAAVGHANLEETTNALAGAWRTGIKGATSFHEAVSTVNSIIGAGNMSMDQFNAAIGTGILPSAKTFGLSMKQVGAALALMTDEGIDSASAATRLRMSFSLLGAPSKAAEKQLGKIGLTGLNLADAMRGPKGLIGAIGLLKDHLDKSGLSASKQSQLLSRAFGGGRSSSGILLMLNNLDVLEKKQLQINRSTGRFDDAVKQQRKTAEAQWHLLTSNLEVMGIRVGTRVLPPVTSFIHFLATDAMPAAGRFGETMGKIIPVGKIKAGFSEARKLVGDFVSGLRGPKQTKLPTPMLKAPTVPAAIALPPAKLSGAGKLGKQIRDAISGGVENIDWSKVGAAVGHGLGAAVQWVAKNGAQLTKKLGVALGGLDWVDVGKQLGTVALPTAIGFVNSVFDPLFKADFWKKHWLDTILAVISAIPFGKLGGAFGKLFEHIPWGKAFGPIGRAFGKIPWGKIIPFGERLSGILADSGRFVARITGRLIESFGRQFPRLTRFFSDQLLLLPVRLGDLGRLLVRKGGELIGKLGQSLVTHIPGMGNRFTRGILKIFGRFTLWQFGVNLAKSLFFGMLNQLSNVGSWLKHHLVDPVINWVKSGFGIASPSKVFTGIGRNLVIGLKNGIFGIAKSIGGWVVAHVVTPVTSRFSGAGSWLIGKGRSLVGGFKGGVLAIAKSLGGWIRAHMVNPATAPFLRAGSWLISKGSALVGGLKSGILNALKGIGGWIKSHFVNPIVGWVRRHFGINSPSRVFMSIGASLTKGLVRGMAKQHPGAIVKKVFGGLPQALGAFIKKGLISAKNLPSAALKALGGLGGDVLGLLGLGGSGGGSSANQKIGEALAAARGWSGPQWAALKNLWNGESGWNERALNKSSGAYGIPQSLPASKMASAGGDWKTNASTQIKWGLSYIASRYGSPLNAYSAWMSRSPHWYAKGTGGAAPGLAWVGEKGPELVNFKGGEDVLSNPQSMAFAKANGIKLPGYASGTITNAADRVHRDKQRVEDAKDAVANAKRRHKGVAAAEKRLKAAERELQAANIALRNARRSAKTSISNTISTGLLKKLETGTSSAIASAIKSVATKLLNAGYTKTARGVMSRGSKLEKLTDKRSSVQKQIAAANQYVTDQAGTIKDFLSISGTSASSIGDLIAQAGAQQKTASGFVSLTKSLKARGASKDLLEQLAESGPGSQLAAILGAKGTTTGDIAKLNKLMSSGGKLANSFGKDMADLMYDSGKNAGKGFLAGLKAQEKSLTKQINKLATDLVKAIKKALKIKSPSGVFRDEVGKQVVLGMVHGMDMHSHLVGASAQRLADTATGVSMRRRYVPIAAAGRAGSAEEDARWERLARAIEASASEVHVHFQDDRLKDLIDVQVKPKIKASEASQAHRAKVGRRS